MIPVLAVTFKIVLPVETKKFPAASTARPMVYPNLTEVAGTPYTMGPVERPCAPDTVDKMPDDALGEVVGVVAVGDPVVVDTGVNEGALVTASLGATSEYVTFLTT